MAAEGHIIVFRVTTGDKFGDGDEGVIAEPTMEKSEHRWCIMEGSIAAEEAIVGEEVAPQFADEGCTDEILRLTRREADEDCLYDFFHVLDLQSIFHMAGPAASNTLCALWR